MKGSVVRNKIKAKGITLKSVAEVMGESPQNFQSYMYRDDIRTGTLERIAAAIGESVSYFYNELPIISVEDYARVRGYEQEIEYLKTIIEEKNSIIEALKNRKTVERKKVNRECK